MLASRGHRPRRFLLAAFVAAVLLAGCGDDDSTTAAEAPMPQEASTTSESESGGSGILDEAETPAGPKLEAEVEDSLAIFLPPDQQATDVSCSIAEEQKAGKVTQQELACTYEVNGVVQTQRFLAVDPGTGPVNVAPVRAG